MSRFLNGWRRFWFGPIDPLPGSLFRISLGVLMTVAFIGLYPNWEIYFSKKGVIENLDNDSWSIFYWLEDVTGLYPLWWLAFLAALGFTMGFQTRACTIMLYLTEVSMIHSNRMVINGEDLIFRMLLFYASFTDLGRMLSIDSWLKSRRGPGPPDAPAGCAWPIRLMQINFALIYAISLPNKLVDDIAWLNGEAVYWAVVNDMWSRCPYPEIFYWCNGLMSKVATYGTILAEGAFPILVCFKRTRLWAIAALALIHLGIAMVLSNVTFFSLSMICALWMFVPGETISSISIFSIPGKPLSS